MCYDCNIKSEINIILISMIDFIEFIDFVDFIDSIPQALYHNNNTWTFLN